MKNIKKLLSILMVLTLVLALGAQAFAATVTIEGDHDYVAYQVFKGTQDAAKPDDAPLGQVEWGDGVNKETILDALKKNSTIGTKFQNKEDGSPIQTAADVAEVVATFGENSAELRAFGEVVLANKGTGVALTGEGAKNELPVGYYVIEDTTALEGADTQNDIIIQVTKDVDITVKHDIPESHKKVQDKNDTTGEATTWQTSADWDIGDEVPFQLSGTVQNKNYDSYTTYYMSFVDVMSPGLQYVEGSYEVYYMAGESKVDLTDSFKMTGPTAYTSEDPAEAKFTGGTTFTWSCDDIKELGVPAGATIYVEYKAELLDKAVIGDAGNPNKSHIEFSNKPGEDSHGKTPDETVIVFTYQMDVTKVDGGHEPLEGAEFALYKQIDESKYTKRDGDEIVYLNDKYEEVGAETEGAQAYLKQQLTATAKEDGGKKNFFSSKGLDDGKYVIVETKVPAGYNKAEPVPFEIKAGHGGKDDPLALDSLSADPLKVEKTEDGKATGVLSTDVINNSGVELPETGGIGTTIFYAAGGILVAAAVILLVTKRRVSGAEK